MKKGLFDFNVHDIVEIAMFVSIALILDNFLKIPLGASGGSINLSLLPLVFLALRHGWFKGLFAGGFVYGLITCLLDNYGPASYPLDYLVGFGSTCIIGLFAPYINNNYGKSPLKTILSYVFVILSVVIWATTRLFASSCNSVLLWEYGFKEALIYNLSYVFISAAADAILLCVLLIVIVKLNKIFPTSFILNYLVFFP